MHQAGRPRGQGGANVQGRGEILTTRVGLRIPSALPFDSWQLAGAQIARVVNSSAWCLGDWLVYGQERYADRYRTAIEAVGLDYQTLRNYAWVTRRFDFPRRRQQLTFQHHAEVASLAVQLQDEWLDRAERKGWSRNELRLAVRDARQRVSSSTAASTLLPRVRVTADRIDRWRAAAEQSEHDFEDWLVATLDWAATRELGADDGSG
jgi:hypothetical protein